MKPPPPGAAPEPATAEAGEHASRVVGTPLLGIGQRVVGGLHLLELLLGPLVAGVAVRVVLARQLAVRLLDLVGARLLADAEDGVEVAISHAAPYSLTTTRAARSTWPSRR